MAPSDAILVIDQGTTSSRAIIYSTNGNILSIGQLPVKQSYPQSGWVEQDPVVLFDTVLESCHKALKLSKLPIDAIAGIGITNQRETTIVWDQRTGHPIYPAIVWQDRRTQPHCEALKTGGHEALITQKTGLLLDPYFSATKIAWILDHVDNARELADAGHLLAGTVDSWLIWKLTGEHITDLTNACRTQLVNIHTHSYDPELLSLFNIPEALLPRITACTGPLATTQKSLFGKPLTILSAVGDQQGALIGQGCFETGMSKSTFGTGCFLMTHTGNQPVYSKNKLLTTIAWKIGDDVNYAIEGSIFNAGTLIEWLMHNLQIIQSPAETETLARQSQREDIHFIPAFTGLGAPYWRPEARGSLSGLDRDTNKCDIVKAALDSIAYQLEDLLRSIRSDGVDINQLRVDGGMTKNHWLMQRIADISQISIKKAAATESTAQGAFYLAALALGRYQSLAEIVKDIHTDHHFLPKCTPEASDDLYASWQTKINQCIQS
ncbi:MAG: glycerol kinase GlpK [Cellvibrionales bacterium]|nr:glycerol kinase GlpK [Cellvibrionales bacterium]